MTRKTLVALAAAITLAGVGVAGQTLLPGFVSAAHAQGSEWSFVGPAPITLAPTVRAWGDNSGRITSVATAADNAAEVFIGSAGGGVWKSTDSGKTWKALNDSTDSSVRSGSSLAIGSLWVDKTGQRLYAGTGELNENGDSQYGTGALRSTDGGTTWTSIGRGTLNTTRIGGIAADQTTATKVFAATDKGLYTSPNNGLFWRQVTDLTNKIPSRTTFTNTGASNGKPDQSVTLTNPYRGVGAVVTVGGATWTQVPSFSGESSTAHVYTLTLEGSTWTITFGNGTHGEIPPIFATIKATYSPAVSGQVFEVQQDPTNSARWWASFGDKCRSEEGGIAKSDDHGVTWNVIASNRDAGRVGLGVGADDKTAYASFSSCLGSLMSIQKTTNAGGAWNTIPSTTPGYQNYFQGTPSADDPNGQGTYDNVVAVDPTDANRAAFGGITILTTSDGGAKFTDAGRVYTGGVIHPDFHALAFTGASSFYAGEDGGLWHTTDMGGSGTATDWTNLNGGTDATKRLAITQLYAGTALSSSNLLGGTQDNGSVSPVAGGTPPLPSMSDIVSGDGGYTAIDPTNSAKTGSFLYTEFPSLNIQRLNGTPPTLTRTRISPCAANSPAGRCVVGQVNDRTAFAAPFVMDLSNPDRLLAGSARVYETTNAKSSAPGTPTWNAISPRLTKFDQGYLSFIALPPTGGTTVFTTSNDGKVFRTTDTKTWTDVTGNLPQPSSSTTNPGLFPFLTSVTFNPTDSAEAWVTVGELGVGQVYHTTNADKGADTTWTNVTEGTDGTTALPTAPALSVVMDPKTAGAIDVGTYYGVWQCSTCAGSTTNPSWQRLGTKLPINAEVAQLTVTQDKTTLFAWTFGRGIWKLTP